MKKLISSLTIVAAITFGFANVTLAEEVDSVAIADSIAQVEADAAASAAATAGDTDKADPKEEKEPELNFVQTLKQKFIQDLTQQTKPGWSYYLSVDFH